ncbi:hypothetical protein [Nocardia sp. NBC_01327]|uniref:hypothetical protein n=1 Tax=Nocardia sp. NBC_01327 TaxID=2903593 RepID=UPI002E0DAC61|nr:hypothetical protein OG326_12245 [Nocardia sp. NBC_01327]
MAIERLGGTPEDPDHRPNPDTPPAGEAHPTEPLRDESAASGSATPPGPDPQWGNYPLPGVPVYPPPVSNPTLDLPGPTVEFDASQLPGASEAPRHGSMQSQEAGITQPRPPTVAEARAREKARKRAEEQAQAEIDAAEGKRKKRKKVLLGGAAVVGVAALVGGGYLAYDAITTPDVTASCTVVAKNGETVPIGPNQTITATQDNQEIVVPDQYCQDAQDPNRGGSGLATAGLFFLAGHQYRYYYGGPSQTIGHAPTGGSTTIPKGANVKTKSGTTIQRGGLGSKLHGGGS